MSNTDTEPMILIDQILMELDQLKQQPITELLLNLDYIDKKVKGLKSNILINLGNLPPLKPTKPGVYYTRFYRKVDIYHLTQFTNKIVGRYTDASFEIDSPNSYSYWTKDGVAIDAESQEDHSDIVLFVRDLPSFI